MEVEMKKLLLSAAVLAMASGAAFAQETVKLLGRKWIIRAPDGTIEIVEGDGIVGENPTLPPGEKFSYNSYHLAGGPLTAEGSFHGTTQSGERIYTRIPVFALTPPSDPS